MIAVLEPFAPVFSRRVWERAKVQAISALLTPGRRTVAAVLPLVGLSQDPHFGAYDRDSRGAAGASAIE